LFSLQTFNEFQTTQLLDIEGGYLSRQANGPIVFNAEYIFPWDQYTLTTVFLAIGHENNATLPILRVVPVDFADNFSPNVMDSPATSHFNGTTDAPSRTVSLTLTRTPLAKSFILTIYAVNWLLTVMVLFITVGAFRLDEKRVPDALLALPVTVILIVPSLRALMVGSPEFGSLSFFVGYEVRL
jgi:hypothetical protein